MGGESFSNIQKYNTIIKNKLKKRQITCAAGAFVWHENITYYRLSLIPLFCLFLSGSLRRGLLYNDS